MVSELIQLIPGQVEKVYAVNEWINSNQLILQNVNVGEIDQTELERISQLQTPNKVLAVFRQQPPKNPSSSFVLYLDTIQDPGNFGTIIRIADWFGVKDVVCTEGCADLYNSKVVQSTMASIARVNVVYDKGLQWLKQQQVPIYAAVLDGKPLNQCNKTNKGILIIGNESKGISSELIDYATEKITIPKKGDAESLNAAVATGIILSHLLS